MRIILVILAVGLLFGCKTTQQVPIHDSTSVTASETITEDPTWTVPAEAYWKLVFECDSNYEVLLRDYEYLNTGIKDRVEIKEKIVYRPDNRVVKQLSVDISALVDSIEVQNRTIEKLRNEKKTVEVPIEVPGPEVVSNSRFAKFCVRFFFIVMIAGVVFVIVKFKLWRLLK